MRKLVGMLFLYSVATFAAPTAGSGRVMQLLSPTTGWAQILNRLFWTTTGGMQWTDITPPNPSYENLAAVCFLDTTTGWVLLSHQNDDDSVRFDLAFTTNSGTNWTLKHITIPDVDPKFSMLTGQGEIVFLDSSHGWMNLASDSSPAFQSGGLLVTSDGGLDWSWVAQDPGISGSILLVTAEDGWLAGGPGDSDLYATHDGAKSWQKLSLNAPLNVHPAIYPTYSLPIFTDASHGFISVTYSAGFENKSAAVLFATNDGGRTWKPDRTLTNLEESSLGESVTAALANSTWIVAAVSYSAGAAPTLTELDSGAVVRHEKKSDPYGCEISFIDSMHGWLWGPDGLQSTENSGKTWTTLEPGR